MVRRRFRLSAARIAVTVCVAVVALCGTAAAAAVHGVAKPAAGASAGSWQGRVPVPTVIGPIPETATSSMFDRSVFSLAPYGYEEQEFFVKGAANVYDYDANGTVVVKYSGAPYETRIIVYRPVDPRRFSGTVVTEILNMTSNYDLPIMWMSSHQQMMADGDVYVGVTSSPNIVAALKTFNPVRYADLSMAAPPGDTCAGTGINSTAGTEGGLVWDILSQVGAALKSDGPDNPLRGLSLANERVYLTGYSQSGGYLLRYINAINPMARVYDGFLIGSGVVPPVLSKCGAAIPEDSTLNVVRPTAQPVITVMSQSDYQGLGPVDYVLPRPDSDTPADKYRLWQVAGSSHIWNYQTWFGPSAADLAKIGGSSIYFNCDTTTGLSGDFPQQYLLDSALAGLDAWTRDGSAPPIASRIAVGAGGGTALDQYGNAEGGVRTPYVDVPTATYYPSSSTNVAAEQLSCGLWGHEVPLSSGTLLKLYPDHGVYAGDVYNDVENLVRERFLTRADGTRIEDAANDASIPD